MSAFEHRAFLTALITRLTARLSGGTSAMAARTGIWGLEIALVVIIAFSASNLVLTAITPANIGVPSASDSRAPQANLGGNGGLAQQLFFKPLDGSAAPLAEANAKIKLFGTRPGGNGAGTAIVSVNGAAQRSVSTGDRLQNGSKITGIFADRIEIIAEGVAGAIYLLPPKQRAQRKLVAAPETAEMQAFAAMFDLQPTTAGVRIGPRANTALLSNIDIVVGDTVIAVNGAAITDEAALQATLNDVLSGAELALDVRRGDVVSQKTIGTATLQSIFGGM